MSHLPSNTRLRRELIKRAARLFVAEYLRRAEHRDNAGRIVARFAFDGEAAFSVHAEMTQADRDTFETELRKIAARAEK